MKNFYSQKVYTLDLTGIEIYEDELDDTKIFRRNERTGEECEIEWDEKELTVSTQNEVPYSRPHTLKDLCNEVFQEVRGALKDASISIATAQDDMLDGVLKMSDLEDIQDHITRLENLLDPVPFTNGRNQGVTS
jgi:hypothetical protein|tara:strand:+ start:177 stop:578 length:402 start_codon:yes stop_codon:yes gene_type:complete